MLNFSEDKRKVVFILGTRPEAIKLSPLIIQMKQSVSIRTNVTVITTGQHPTMCKESLLVFGIQPDVELDCFEAGQSLVELTARIAGELAKYENLLRESQVIVQGDTTSAAVGGLVAYYMGAELCHIEAGLRSFDLKSPFPEEGNRRMIGSLANSHMCPTQSNYQNLVREGVESSTIRVTGNTVIDALILQGAKRSELNRFANRHILVTLHRRENQKNGLIRSQTKVLAQIAKDCGLIRVASKRKQRILEFQR